jgi:hypothetical protein
VALDQCGGDVAPAINGSASPSPDAGANIADASAPSERPDASAALDASLP